MIFVCGVIDSLDVPFVIGNSEYSVPAAHFIGVESGVCHMDWRESILWTGLCMKAKSDSGSRSPLLIPSIWEIFFRSLLATFVSIDRSIRTIRFQALV